MVDINLKNPVNKPETLRHQINKVFLFDKIESLNA